MKSHAKFIEWYYCMLSKGFSMSGLASIIHGNEHKEYKCLEQ
jgi:hypothetical protein